MHVCQVCPTERRGVRASRCLIIMFMFAVAVLSAAATSSVVASATLSVPCNADVSATASWRHAGPAGYVNLGDKLAMASSGAAQAAVCTGGTSWLVATANGGIWKTEDVLALPEPSWKQVLDDDTISCTSISAMSNLGSTVVAGCGAATSSEMGTTWDVANSGDWAGVMISSDGGGHWIMTSFPANYYISATVVVSPSEFYIGARSNTYDRHAGGVWQTKDGGVSFTRIFDQPVFDLRRDTASGVLLAAVPMADKAEASIWICKSVATLPNEWEDWGSGLDWGGRLSFYPTLALGKGVAYLGSLTVSASNMSDTSSGLYTRSLSDLLTMSANGGQGGAWTAVKGAPRLDRDAMPKDRMALLVHPDDDNNLFVAGNADALVWRVDVSKGTWVVASGKADTSDGSEPHSDCRSYYWEATTSSLILLSDGGAFLRTKPAQPGGRWRSLAGDTGAMELISAHWDGASASWVGGAQDNTVMITPPGAKPTDRATGYLFGDGTVTAVDATVSPSRFYGSTQFLGNFLDDDAGPHRRRRRRSSPERGRTYHDDDRPCGFGYATRVGESLVVSCVPLLDHFDIRQIPFFDHPFALDVTAPTPSGLPVVIWARAGRGRPAGYFTFVPTSNGSFVPPKLIAATDGDVYAFALGKASTTAHAGKSSNAHETVIVGLNNTHLIYSAGGASPSIAKKLPTAFAAPIEFAFSSANTYILGPVSHDRTVSLAVSPVDSSLVAVTGWTSIADNKGTEGIWLTRNAAGAASDFEDVTANLRNTTSVCSGRGQCGKWRPSALLLLPAHADSGQLIGHSLLVGTISGVYALRISSGAHGERPRVMGAWSRLGTCSQIPLVLVAGLSHEPESDTLVAATMGRGVYVLHNATRAAWDATSSRH